MVSEWSRLGSEKLIGQAGIFLGTVSMIWQGVGDESRLSRRGTAEWEQRNSVLVMCDFYLPGFRGGGPVQSLKDIINSASDDIRVVTRNHDYGTRTPYHNVVPGDWTRVGSALVKYMDASPRRWLSLALELRRRMVDVLYINSLQSPVYSLLPLAAVRLRLVRPRVVLVAPRGECSEGALGIKSLKKCLARPLIRSLNRPQRVWHVSSQDEAADLVRWWGEPLPKNHRVLIKGQQAPLPRDSCRPSSSALRDRDVPTILFASRIDPMKGLTEAIEAVGRISVPCRFLIHGSVSSEAYWERCQALLSELPNTVEVQVWGEFEPSDLRGLLEAADVFILPTRGENFGHAIASALAAGCPVVTSDRTIWSNVAIEGGGAATDDPDEMAASLGRICSLRRDERADLRVMTAQAYRRWYEANRDDTPLFSTAMSLGQLNDD